MELTNLTGFPATLFRAVIDEERLCASVLSRVTYDWAGERLTVAAEQVWKVSPAPWESPYGPMDGDEVFIRGGVDLFVFGSARAPDNRPVSRVEVSLEVGDSFRRRLLVFGDRVWKGRTKDLLPGEPAAFVEMPLDLAHAFGGKDDWDGLAVPFPDNPEGKGYYIDKENAAGKPLPNIEDPDHPIRRWDDRPEPVGVRPVSLFFGPRLQRGAVFDEKTGEMEELRPEFFNAAFPGMIAPRLVPGERVTLRGVSASGPVGFVIPDTKLLVRLAFGDEVVERPLAIDQVGIEPDARRVFIAYRYPFRYRLIPLQRRTCELAEAS